MSNPTTNLFCKNASDEYQDLSGIFQPLSEGSSIGYNTNILVNVDGTYTDLKDIFASLSSGSSIGYDTNILTNGSGSYTDLSNIFAEYNSKTTFTTTSGLLTTSYNTFTEGTLASNFNMPSGYNYFNFVIYGGGGDGNDDIYAYTASYGTSGGGSGGVIKSINIPYTDNSTSITSITYGVSGGNGKKNSYILVSYSDESEIKLNGGTGETVIGEDGSSDNVPNAKGGVNSYSNTTSFYDDSSNITINVDGSDAGTKNHNGVSSGYTVSGSGVGPTSFTDDGVTAIPYATPTSVSNTYDTDDGESYTLSSTGAGKSQLSSGYGAGGTTFTSGYSYASAYKSTQGVILYYLSQ